VPDATFVLVGGDRANGFGSNPAVVPLLESGRLRLIDRQPRAAIPAYHAMADVLVSPRAHGGNLPLKVFDYLAAGRPIVATDIPTHRTVLNEERAVLVAPESQALAGGILSLLEQPERAERLARAASGYAREHLGWDAFVHSVGEIYEEVHSLAAR
jgi:glycosyltransferase involved in cell wall biosynthesis